MKLHVLKIVLLMYVSLLSLLIMSNIKHKHEVQGIEFTGKSALKTIMELFHWDKLKGRGLAA